MSGSAVLAAAWAVGGLLLGAAYFAALWRTSGLLFAGGGRAMPAILTLGRFAAAVLVLAAATRCGAMPLLTAFFGFLIARGIALHGS